MYFARKGKTPAGFFLTLITFIATLLNACSPAATSTPPTDTPASPNTEITEAPITATSEVEEVFPYYLPLVTKPDVAPQTITGVTVSINWVYVDESRVSVSCTISGLDLPEGAMLDTSMVRIQSSTVSDIGYGGGGWNTVPIQNGVTTVNLDQFFAYGALNADEHATIDLGLDIPIDGTSSVFLPAPRPGNQGGLQESIPAPNIGTFHLEFRAPVLKSTKLENLNQASTASDVTMTLKTFILTPSYAQALLCFQMPSAVDWGLSASLINIGGKGYPITGFGLLPGTSGKNFTLNDPERCVSAGFNVPFDESLKSITLNIPKLVSSVPEVITKERVAAANNRLAGTGIEFDYVNLDHGGNIEILKRPGGAKDEEVFPLIWEALADQYDGPWVFTVELPK